MDSFCSFTGTSREIAKMYIDKYSALDVAVDAYYTDPNEFGQASSRKTESDRNAKLSSLYERYKTLDPGEDNMALNGTIKWCEDLGVDPQDVVLLALAYELKSNEMCVWEKKGWIDGWRNLGCDSIESMKAALGQLSRKLGSDPTYFNAVYAKTFTFGLAQNQRHLALDMAIGFWSLLIPHALAGGAIMSSEDSDESSMEEDGKEDAGWTDEYTSWWFAFLTEKGLKGVTRDVWSQFPVFIRSIGSNFARYNADDSWPTVIDEFVERAREKLKG